VKHRYGNGTKLVRIRCGLDHGKGESYVLGMVSEYPSAGQAFLFFRDAVPPDYLRAHFLRGDAEMRSMSRDWQISERMWEHRARGGMTINSDGSKSWTADPLVSPYCPTHKVVEIVDWPAFFNALSKKVATARELHRPQDLAVPLSAAAPC
jgi:hypothetical protein